MISSCCLRRITQASSRHGISLALLSTLTSSSLVNLQSLMHFDVMRALSAAFSTSAAACSSSLAALTSQLPRGLFQVRAHFSFFTCKSVCTVESIPKKNLPGAPAGVFGLTEFWQRELIAERDFAVDFKRNTGSNRRPASGSHARSDAFLTQQLNESEGM